MHQRPIITQSIATDSIKTSVSRDTFGTPVEGDTSSPVGGIGNGNGNGSIDAGRHGRRGDVEVGDSLSPHGHGHGLGVGKKNGGKRKSILVRNRNPVGRLFDGVVEDDDGEEEEKEVVDEKAGKWNTPTLTTPMFYEFADVTSLEDPFIANPPPRISRRPRRPYASSRNLVSRSRILTPVGSSVCIPPSERERAVNKELAESSAETTLRDVMKRMDGVEMGRWRYI